jgi:metal transporter CNNM
MGTFVTLILILVLLALSATFSGLTIGILSLNVFELKRKSELNDAAARLVYPIRARGNELLVTLIIGNVLVNTGIAILMSKVIPGGSVVAGFVTVIIVTALITMFGEILPQAFFRRHGLAIAARFAPYITIFMEILRPISRPLGMLIDKTVGLETPDVYSTDELMMILDEHEASDHSDIEADEMMIVKNALSFGDKLVRDVMTPKSVVKAISADQTFTMGVLKDLTDSGHSRFPVYEGDLSNVVGILYLRDLISNHSENLTAGKAADRNVNFVNEKQLLDHVLNGFIKTKKHLFIVINEFAETVGLITIEDILEEIIGREIVDEFDKFDDLREVARLRAQKRKRKNVVGKIN